MTPNFEFRSAGAGTIDRAEFAKWINVRNPLSKSTKDLLFHKRNAKKQFKADAKSSLGLTLDCPDSTGAGGNTDTGIILEANHSYNRGVPLFFPTDSHP